MQDHLKERLTGAAILVIVVVLLVPELFRGPPNANPKTGGNAIPGPPVRSVTIDLRDSAMVQPPAASAEAPAAPAMAAANVPARASAAPTAPAASTLASPTASAPPASAPTPAPAAAPAPSKSAASVAGSHAGGAKSGWTVQVGSFARRDYAERMAKQVTAKGYSVEVAGPDDRGLYRVRSALQPDHAAATALKQKMQASGLKPIVNTAP